tara:strand:- start:1872 stop:2468 length:597 start_codon:yes stop_codon:yes gene_type:complete
MLELFQKMLKDKLTPNQLFLLYGIKNSISFPVENKEKDAKKLIELGLVVYKKPKFTISAIGNRLCAKYNSIFSVAKKRTTSQLLGKGYAEMLAVYREAFPAGKLPSGKPGRQNLKTLENGFRWFFETYDYTWDEVAHATVMYINEYRDKDYMYMKTSQYFICKTDKHKVKHSELADYCDMVRDGVEYESDDHFKEKVV